ncbi:MAG: BspA family leucine-rich repeat surface protein, partial [Bacteroidota bacterium]
IDSIGGAEEYFYRIKAFNENGESDYSNTLTVAGARPFITLWEIEAAETITISLIRPKSYDFEYKWLKDGTVVESGRFTQNNIKTENVTTTFDEAGSYQLEINGIFPGGGFSAEKMREIIQWGGIAWETLGFRGWQGNITATDAPNLSKVTSLSGIFREATNVNADLSNWDVSTITNMERAFQGATSFNGNISSWDVSNVTNMKEMFSGASTFNSDISSWNVERVVNMASTFKNATAFNGNINGWNVANVEDMSDLFFSAPAFNQDLNSWNVSAVTNMGGIFSRATNFNGNISNWNTSKVTNLGNAFSRTENFNGDISGWNTESVTSMGNTFDKANAFDQDLSGWNVASVTNMKNMFRDGVLSTLNYDKILNSWSQQDVRSDVELNVNSFYCESEQARQSLIDTKGWSIGDRGKKCEQPTDIVSFTFAEQGSNTSSINTANHTVTVEVEAGSDITSLVPDITVSNGATISPASGVAQNFTNPFTYTVTSQDGSITQAWVVTVSVETLNNETDFISFTIPERRSDAVINSSDHTISAEVLNGTDVTKLQPTFTLSDGATSTPVSGSEVDFTNPVNYSITAEDGTTTQTWVVTVTESQETSSNQTDILSFELVSQVSPTIIDFDNHTVEAFASNGTDLTALSPTIALSAGATSTPAMGTPVDFTNPVNYLVTAEDEITTQQWTVTVTEAEAPLNNETDILSFEVDNQVSAALINAGSSSIEVEVINGTDLTQLTPAFTLSDGATSSPGSGQQVDFTNPVNYIITAEDGTTTQSWTVTITEAQEPLSTETDIISFEVDNQVSAAVIDAENHSVEVEVINGTDLTELNPAITISEGATSSPASGTTVDFSSLVNYEITAEDGVTTQTWEVTVTEEPILTNITDALKWRVYPNPADQLLYIESNRTVTVYLVDLYGRKISEDHTGKNIELKMPDVAPGPYLLMISDNNKLDYQRIYKN